MKIFVAYGYNDRDQWVRDLVFPIIEAFGSQVETGEEVQGEQIPDAVRKKIEHSDALIAFTARREQLASGRWTTHRWVTDELALALQNGLLCVEVREQDVDRQGGVASTRQFIEYDEKGREKCIVELVKTIGKWHREAPVLLQLRPAQFVDQVRPLLSRIRCTYTVLVGSRESEFGAKIRPIRGGLFINVSIPRQALIQVCVEIPGEKPWLSDFETIEAFTIDLKQG